MSVNSKCSLAKIPTQYFLRIVALASKRRLNKEKDKYIHNIFFDYLKIISLDLLLAGADILKKFRWFFGPNDDIKRTF